MGKIGGFADILRRQAQRNIREIAARTRFAKNHPQAKHAHTRENARRLRQMQHWIDWANKGGPEFSMHSGQIVLDASTRNVYSRV